MKHMRKIFALALALIMAMSLATGAFAAAPAEDTITIEITDSASGASVTGHTYEVYQIFTGDVAEDGKTLTNAEFGDNYAPEGMSVTEAMEELEAMSGAEAAAFLAEKISGEAFATLNDGNGHKVEGVEPGYYLIIDVSEDLPESEINSAYILQVLEDVEVKSKHSAGPIVLKKIDDTNDSVDATNNIVWDDSADHDIGDDIDFKLEMTVPSVIAQFVEYDEDYRFVFHDTEEKGLAYNGDAVAYIVNGDTETPIDTALYSVITDCTDCENCEGCTFDVVFPDLTAIEGIKAGSVIRVYYTSELTEDAVIGNQGNVNEVYGEYANLHRPEYPGFTPKDTVIAFTYKVIVNKTHQVGEDEEGNPIYEALTGAEFTLEKYNKATDSWIAIDQVETTAGTVFTFEGLDDGEYRLTETETPDGYNSIDPIEFTVTADHNIVWETQDRLKVLNSLSGNVTTGEIEFTVDTPAGSLSSDVENMAGIELPETGGIGTTIFYIVGGLLVAAAVILLVTKKRMSSAK